MNGEKDATPLKMPVALIDILAGHQLKEAVLIALLKKHQTQQGSNISVSLFDSAVASLANQATNWLIANQLPTALGSLHPNIAPYGEVFLTQDKQHITFAIGTNLQFKKLCNILDINSKEDEFYNTNHKRVENRAELFDLLNKNIKHKTFEFLYKQCLNNDIPIGKIRNLKEVFELPAAKQMIQNYTSNKINFSSVKSVAFKFLK